MQLSYILVNMPLFSRDIAKAAWWMFTPWWMFILKYSILSNSNAFHLDTLVGQLLEFRVPKFAILAAILN